jgi:hypothetical protein
MREVLGHFLNLNRVVKAFPTRHLSLEEMHRVDAALRIVLEL